ncbi:hypothetical protein DRO64_02425 [Candidatus Bathyarchaeota archaeon]|nr:MAG: hypothetical protein DRO64_02425 [Candidatus Bathyarchaeota archaeon]HDM89368.1 hypothetical protein [Candidatus Bathyarchaeota archaeon]
MHDINLAARYCDMLILLSNGRIRAIGKPEDILTRDNIRETFGVEVLIKKSSITNSIFIIPLGTAASVKKNNPNTQEGCGHIDSKSA